MKTKIDLDHIADMTFVDYQKKFKKEIERAQTFGKMNCVVLGDFEFACGHIGSIIVLGTYSGNLTKFYKQMKRERKGKKDFAVGTTIFEKNEDGTTTLHVGLTDGMAKPTKLKKNSRKLFKKVGMHIEFTKGELTEKEASIMSKEELHTINEEGEELSDDKKIETIYRKYTKAFKSIVNVVVPNLKENKVEDADFDQIRQLNVFARAFLEESEMLSEKKREKWQEKIDGAKAQLPKVKAIYAKVKVTLSKQNNAGDHEVIVDELLQKCHDDITSLADLYTVVTKEIEAEKKMPVEPSGLNVALENYQKNITACETQIQAYQDENLEINLIELKVILQQHSTQSIEGERMLEEFERVRKEEIEKAAELNKLFEIIEKLDGHKESFLTAKKGEKVLFSYEKTVLTEIVETIKLWIQKYNKLNQRVQPTFQDKKIDLDALKGNLDEISSTYKIESSPTNKDEMYNQYVTIDQSLPLNLIIESVEKMDQWMNEQETLREAFSENITLDVDHFYQGDFKSKNKSEMCKDACEKMVNDFLKKNDPDAKGFEISNFSGDGFISVTKEDKSKIKDIVKTDDTVAYQSIDNDAMEVQDTANEGYQYIFDYLDTSKPVVIGVDHTYNRVFNTDNKRSSTSKDGGYNEDKTTDHFIVVYGKGMDKGMPYLLYLDPGRSKSNGDNEKNNRLFPLWEKGQLVWYDPDGAMLGSNSYVLSAVCKFKKD